METRRGATCMRFETVCRFSRQVAMCLNIVCDQSEANSTELLKYGGTSALIELLDPAASPYISGLTEVPPAPLPKP